MRILITNDDGIFAPGIAALARGLAAELGGRHELVVVAPLVDHSGASSAVGAVYDRESIPFEEVEVRGLDGIPSYGIDGTPALAVILACIEGFGPRPDMVISGINHGANTGRSALHSGTIGAALTGAQFGLSGLAVSIAWGPEPVPWETPVALANRCLPALIDAPQGTVLNLNVPALPLARLRGLRRTGLGSAGLIRAARSNPRAHPVTSVDRTGGVITLTLRGGRGSDRNAEQREIDPDSDAGAVTDGWAVVTPLVGVREDRTGGAEDVIAKLLADFGE